MRVERHQGHVAGVVLQSPRHPLFKDAVGFLQQFVRVLQFDQQRRAAINDVQNLGKSWNGLAAPAEVDLAQFRRAVFVDPAATSCHAP